MKRKYSTYLLLLMNNKQLTPIISIPLMSMPLRFRGTDVLELADAVVTWHPLSRITVAVNGYVGVPHGYAVAGEIGVDGEVGMVAEVLDGCVDVWILLATLDGVLVFAGERKGCQRESEEGCGEFHLVLIVKGMLGARSCEIL